MNIREAILSTARLFESNPRSYNFGNNGKPDCGSPGCMMGWIGVHLGVEVTGGSYVRRVAEAVGFDFPDLGDHAKTGIEFTGFTASAAKAAMLLRSYADKYHPATLAATPDWWAMASKPTVPAHVELGPFDTAWRPERESAQKGAA